MTLRLYKAIAALRPGRNLSQRQDVTREFFKEADKRETSRQRGCRRDVSASDCPSA